MSRERCQEREVKRERGGETHTRTRAHMHTHTRIHRVSVQMSEYAGRRGAREAGTRKEEAARFRGSCKARGREVHCLAVIGCERRLQDARACVDWPFSVGTLKRVQT